MRGKKFQYFFFRLKLIANVFWIFRRWKYNWYERWIVHWIAVIKWIFLNLTGHRVFAAVFLQMVRNTCMHERNCDEYHRKTHNRTHRHMRNTTYTESYERRQAAAADVAVADIALPLPPSPLLLLTCVETANTLEPITVHTHSVYNISFIHDGPCVLCVQHTLTSSRNSTNRTNGCGVSVLVALDDPTLVLYRLVSQLNALTIQLGCCCCCCCCWKIYFFECPYE